MRSEGKAKPSSKSSSIVDDVGRSVAIALRVPVALMVDTPSSSSSSSSEEMTGGRMVNMGDDCEVEREVRASDRTAIPAMTA